MNAYAPATPFNAQQVEPEHLGGAHKMQTKSEVVMQPSSHPHM
eukprot:CAMPEP_0183400954 /NCGR_PEP_ID=MMETSP0370-20130417/12941_1 /TAXON_ID=268820 /ORGANISM="Peridinium aciculiferum, Strain PAER-2" /LENGTH=42 /DNA_ID= /DNA_START= /DNA_END= /DNA_ORIENTATION=